MDYEKEFESLKERWISESYYISSIHTVISFRSYQEIIKLGWPVVPFILKDLQNSEPNYWFYALMEITGDDPVPKEDKGLMKKMASHWIKWGESKGFL